MSSMEEDVASAKSRRSGLDLFRLIALLWRSCRLLVVRYAILSIPPGATEGGVSSGETAPAGLMGYISGQNRQPSRWGRQSTYRCDREASLCRKSARRQGWAVALGRVPGSG